MTDLKSLALCAGSGYNGDEQVQFLPDGHHQVTICPSSPPRPIENLNNAVLG